MNNVIAIAFFPWNGLGDSLVSQFKGVKWVKGEVDTQYPLYCQYIDSNGVTQSIARHSAFISEYELMKEIKGIINSTLSKEEIFKGIHQNPNPRRSIETQMLSGIDFDAAREMSEAIADGTFYENYYHPHCKAIRGFVLKDPDSTEAPGF